MVVLYVVFYTDLNGYNFFQIIDTKDIGKIWALTWRSSSNSS